MKGRDDRDAAEPPTEHLSKVGERAEILYSCTVFFSKKICTLNLGLRPRHQSAFDVGKSGISNVSWISESFRVSHLLSKYRELRQNLFFSSKRITVFHC